MLYSDDAEHFLEWLDKDARLYEKGELIDPGNTAVTRIPCSRISSRRTFVKAKAAAFAAQ